MKTQANKLNKNLINYFILSFLISWILWSPFYFSEEVDQFWVLPGAWGPTISALILTYRNKGRTGVKNLLKKLLIWKVPIRYYFFSIFAILLIASISLALYILFDGEAIDIGLALTSTGLQDVSLIWVIVALPLFFLANIVLGGPVAEELGWRGYAQELLQLKYNPNQAGLIIGFLWATWHLPLLIFMPKAAGSMPFFIYIPLMTAMGVIFSWLYNKTKGSVLLAILLHGGMNFTLGFLGAELFTNMTLLLITVALIILCAIFLARDNRKTSYHKTGLITKL